MLTEVLYFDAWYLDATGPDEQVAMNIIIVITVNNEINYNPLVQIIFGEHCVFTYAIWHEISMDLHQKVNCYNT